MLTTKAAFIWLKYKGGDDNIVEYYKFKIVFFVCFNIF